MNGESEGKLPLHDEAKARSKWRGGETLIEDDGDSGPASEVDHGAASDGQGRPEGKPLGDLAKRPPD